MSLKSEFHYYIKHQDDLVKQYKDKYIVIKNHKLLGAYDSEIEAIEETLKSHKLGTFLVKKCEAGTKSYTKNFYSRVAFNNR